MSERDRARRPHGRRFLLASLVLFVLPACSDGGGRVPTGLQRTAGDGQVATVGAMSEPMSVVVTNAQGETLPGIVVFWSVEEGEGAVSAEHARTDNDGQAEVAFTAGLEPGPVLVSAWVVSLDPVHFTVVDE